MHDQSKDAARSCQACPLNGRFGFDTHSASEMSYLDTIKRGERIAKPGELLLREEERNEYIFTVLSGFGIRTRSLADGRRQILNYVFPGDMIGLQGAVLEEMTHSVEVLSTMTACMFDRSAIHDIIGHRPALGYDVVWLASREESMLEDNLLSVGRRSALERCAYLLSTLHARGLQTGLFEEGQPIAPITQTHFADTLGLSLVHTNKTLRKLQATNVISWRGKSCSVLDADALYEIAGFEGLPGRPRPFV